MSTRLTATARASFTPGTLPATMRANAFPGRGRIEVREQPCPRAGAATTVHAGGTMLDHPLPYGFGATVALPFPVALERTREALIAEGFGIMSEVDVRRTLSQRIGVEIPPYVILGACNPPLAHRALMTEPDVGLLLPCNVVVYQAADPARSVVAALSPQTALALTHNAALTLVAAQVEGRLRRALERLVASRPARVSVPDDAVGEIC